MAHYKVTWIIGIEADNPTEAALKALQIQRDEESQALAFDVESGDQGQCIDLAPTDPPKAEKGAYVTNIYHGIWGELECHFDYSEGCRGSWEGGQQMEPDDPETCTLYAAYWQGHDVSNLLEDDHKEELESVALQRMEKDADEDYDDSHHYAGAW